MTTDHIGGTAASRGQYDKDGSEVPLIAPVQAVVLKHFDLFLVFTTRCQTPP